MKETKKTQTPAIQTIVFDLGGVLVDWDPKYLYRKIFSDEKEMDYFLSHICTPEWNEEQDGGRPLEDATEILIQQYPQYTTEISAFYGRWKEMLGGPIAGTVNILKQLKAHKHLRLFALTNWSAETFPLAYQEHECLHWFEDILVSGREKTRKPFPECFRLLCDRFNITPQKALFIDDNIRNVKAAKNFGFQVIHFISPQQLETALQTRGLLD